MTLPLSGKIIVVTRPAHQAQALALQLQMLGAQVQMYPALMIEPVSNDWLAQAAVLNPFQTAIFISANAVQYGLQVLGEQCVDLHQLKLAAIGQATAQALAEQGFKVNYQPTSGFTSEDLLALPDFAALQPHPVILFQGEGGRTFLAEQLTARGMQVHTCVVYKRLPAPTVPLNWASVDWVLISSVEGLQHLNQQWGETLRPQLRLVVGSQRMAQAARELGFKQMKVAANPSDSAMLAALLNGA